MKITKIGHCCLLIEAAGKRILTDPGSYTRVQNEIDKIDIILITHEHADHLHLESLQIILRHNPQAHIFTNSAVGQILTENNINFSLLEDKDKVEIDNLLIEGFGNNHAEIYNDFKLVQNTGFMINQRFFYPGDALYVPPLPVEILALPVVAPWVKIKEAIDYALQVRPRISFPVHDGMLKITDGFYKVPEKILLDNGIGFKPLSLLEAYDF